MKDPYLLAAASMSIISFATYCIIAMRGKKKIKPRIDDIVVLLYSSNGFICGIKVMWFALFSATFGQLENQRIYIFFGGVALCWVSIEAMWRMLYGTLLETKTNMNSNQNIVENRHES
jgi:hypothetical protein